MNDNKLSLKYNIIFSFVCILCFAIIAIAITPIEFQNDTFYTIKIGEHIQNNGIDMKDAFSWHEGLSYSYPHWLYDLITYKIYNVLGFKGIYLFTIILCFILAISLYYTYLTIYNNKPLSFLLTILTITFLTNFITARAQLVTYILFVLTICLIEKILKKKKIIYGILLFLISILIANLHSAVWPFFFVLFLPFIVEHLFATIHDNIFLYSSREKRIIKKLNSKKITDNKAKKLQEELAFITKARNEYNDNAKKRTPKIITRKNNNILFLIFIMIICCFSGFLTPIGDTPYYYLAKTMLGTTTQHILEHLPTVLINNPFAIITILFFVILLVIRKSTIRLSHLLLMMGLITLSLLSTRQISLMILLGSIPIYELLINWITADNTDIEKNSNKIFTKPLFYFSMLYLTMCLSSLGIADKAENCNYINESDYPVKACDYIVENVDLKNCRFFNEYNYGSYMIYRNIPVFIDSRADLYTPEFNGEEINIFDDYTKLNEGAIYYEDIFTKYNITHVILKNDSIANVYLSASNDTNYNKLYSDEYFTIYERLNKK